MIKKLAKIRRQIMSGCTVVCNQTLTAFLCIDEKFCLYPPPTTGQTNVTGVILGSDKNTIQKRANVRRRMLREQLSMA